MAGQRRELATVNRLIEREENHREAGFIAESIQQGLQRAHVVGRLGNVGALIAAVVLKQPTVVLL